MTSQSIPAFLLPELALSGRAVLTFRNEAKGTHMTVKFKQVKDRATKKKLPIFFVFISLLGDKTQGMVYAGTYFQKDGGVSLSKGQDPKGRLSMALFFLAAAIKDPQILKQRNVTFQHEGKCCSCAMPLTHPNSIPIGLGPDCLKRAMQNSDFALGMRLAFPELKL
jgi:hypothetical protein